MSRVVPAADIEAIVGVPRGSVRHFARKVPADGQIYTDVGAFTIPTDGPQSGMALGYPGHFYALPFFMVVL